MARPWNTFIEGDNLDVLPTLVDLLGEPVDLVYIDPPYNTGNDFAYVDDFRQDGSRRSVTLAPIGIFSRTLKVAMDLRA